MRRRPGVAALENLVRGISGQPRLVRASQSQTIYPAGIPSAEAFGTPTLTQVGKSLTLPYRILEAAAHLTGRATVSARGEVIDKSGGGGAGVSGGGDVRVKGHESQRTPRERYEWPMQCAGTMGGIGGFVGVLMVPEDPTTGAAVVGVIGITVGWVWASWVDRSG
jgi:hypothetical protein